ncbi:hypothetical protein [Parasegetibacter sp. NRK P23]|uniref:hypothetical protein n=1 Tax=Parasegetibacter sp. NRK P23 TaxID=2942999 RepID=UPI002044A2D9|nr:hypothetical protein [Parasegetibacter sp. NRK P23]MCM5530103.1 hypothetical protein [Parasegetibacter sp. NRK P23]
MNELFFNPEIARRRDQDLLPNDFTLMAAQAILFPDGRPHIVRLNDEVSVDVKLKQNTNHDLEEFWPSSEDVEDVNLNEQDFLNCGHVTMILLKDGFYLSFDFIYNKQICTEHLAVANQFLQTSKFALGNDFVFSFIDNSFSAIELLAKVNLLAEANQNMSLKTSHKSIKSAFNSRYRNAHVQFDIDRREIFNRLSDARKAARYLEGEITFDKSETESICKTIERMYIELCKRVGFNYG